MDNMPKSQYRSAGRWSIFIILILAGIPIDGVYPQSFTRVTTGAPVTEPGAWRSVNWVDYDRDGDLDLFVTRGWSGGQDNVMFRNEGAPGYWFSRMGSLAVSGDHKPSDGSTWGDYDNDRYADLFVVNWYDQDNLLYHNDGGSAFTGVTTEPPGTNAGYSETAAWGDYNNDGLIDLYVSNSSGLKRNFLYRNTGGGHFERVLAGIPVTDQHTSRGVNWVDIDGDGDLDLFVANEGNENEDLYRNMLVETGVDTFARVVGDSLVTAGGSSWSGSWADYDNDGDQDVFVVNWSGQVSRLFVNNGSGSFTPAASGDISADAGHGASGVWGDIDNDGDLDLLVTRAYSGVNERNALYVNRLMESGVPSMERVTTGPIVSDSGYMYGAAWGDYDADGDLDLFVARTRSESQVNAMYRNDGNANKWITLDLSGTVSNASGIGAKISVRAVINGKTVRQMRVIEGQAGYCSQNLQAHFGLGDAVVIDSLRVEWPSGLTDVFTGVATDRNFVIAENDPTPPVPAAPANGFLNTSALVELKWLRSPYPGPYRIQVSTDSTFSGGIVLDSLLGGDTSAVIPVRDKLVRYYWRLMPVRTIHPGLWSTPGYFDNALAVRPDLIEPDDGTQQFSDVTFRWTTSPWATGFHFQYSPDSSFSPPEFEDSTLTDTMLARYGLSPDETYYWRVRARYPDSSGSWTDPYSFRTTPDTFITVTTAAWNLVSVPGGVRSLLKDTLYPAALTGLFAYAGTYVEVDTMEYGRGYWLKMPVSTQVSIPMVSRGTDTVDVSPGWNLIGGLSFPVAVASVAAIPEGLSAGGFFTYDGSYRLTDTLRPGEGYWIRVDSEGSLLLSARSEVNASAALRVVPSSELPPAPPGPDGGQAAGIPSGYVIGQNYPNPFNPVTVIPFYLPAGESIRLRVYNTLGEQVASLAEGYRNAGYQQVEWDATGFTSGIYYYRIEAGGYSETRKMLLVR